MDRKDPNDKIQKSFARTYFHFAASIEGGDGTLVQLNGVMLSTNTMPEYAAKWGCPPGEVAILVDWIPADKDTPKGASTFPKVFQKLPVYYRQGGHVVPY